MKLKIILFAAMFAFFASCTKAPFKTEVIKSVCEISYMHQGKHARVAGYINYNGIPVEIEGYNYNATYKSYNLRVGQKIETYVTVCYYSTAYGYKVEFSQIDLSKYEAE